MSQRMALPKASTNNNKHFEVQIGHFFVENWTAFSLDKIQKAVYNYHQR